MANFNDHHHHYKFVLRYIKTNLSHTEKVLSIFKYKVIIFNLPK